MAKKKQNLEPTQGVKVSDKTPTSEDEVEYRKLANKKQQEDEAKAKIAALREGQTQFEINEQKKSIMSVKNEDEPKKDTVGATVDVAALVKALTQGVGKPGDIRPTATSRGEASREFDSDKARERWEKSREKRRLIRDDRRLLSAEYPSSEYGWTRVPVPRYTAEGIAKFGATRATANPSQLMTRNMLGFTGDGDYYTKRWREDDEGDYVDGLSHVDGQGAYWNDAWKWAKKNIGPVLKENVKPLLGMGARAGLKALTGALAMQPGVGTILSPLVGELGSRAIDGLVGIEGSGDYIAPEYLTEEFFKGLAMHPDGRDILEEVGDLAARGVSMNSVVHNQVSKMVPLHHQVAGSDGTTSQTNSIVNPGAINSRQRTPMMTSIGENKNGDLLISFREYIGNVTSEGTYFHTARRIELNPGLAESFPTLSQFAKMYQFYEFDQLLVEYESEVATGNNQSQGTIMIAPQSNPTQFVFPNKASMLNSALSVTSRVESNCIAGLECKDSQMAAAHQRPFIRTTSIPLDEREDYDFGFVQVALDGVPVALGSIGSLYISYTCKLFNMKTEISNQIEVGNGAQWVQKRYDVVQDVFNYGPAPFGYVDVGVPVPHVVTFIDPAIRNASITLIPNPYGPANNQVMRGVNIKFEVDVVSGTKYDLALAHRRIGFNRNSGNWTEFNPEYSIVNRSTTTMGRNAVVTNVISEGLKDSYLVRMAAEAGSILDLDVLYANEISISSGNSRVSGIMFVDVDIVPASYSGYERNFDITRDTLAWITDAIITFKRTV